MQVGYLACTSELKNGYKIFVENVTGRDHLEDPSVYGRIILKHILRNRA